MSLLPSKTVFHYVLVADCSKSKPTASRDSQCHNLHVKFRENLLSGSKLRWGTTETVIMYFLFLWRLDPDDVNVLGGSIHTLKENAEASVAATREIGLEVSADKTKYMVMSRY